MPSYTELHSHSNYSFHEGASSIQDMLKCAKKLGYSALALTDHNNLCGAMEFSQLARSLSIQPIIGAEITLLGGYHITLLVETTEGYSNLCRIISASGFTRNKTGKDIDPELLSGYSKGLIALSGCSKGEIPLLAHQGKLKEAEEVIRRYKKWFGKECFYLELQQNLVQGDTLRIRNLVHLAEKNNLEIVATNNAHYHIRERHQLHDCLVSIKNRRSLEESHTERRANSEFYLKSQQEMSELFDTYPNALENTSIIARRCSSFDLTRNLNYSLPTSKVPIGYTQDEYLRHLCDEAAIRRYGINNTKVKARLDEEFRLIKRHNLTGFLLIYYEIIHIAREVMIDLNLTNREIPIEERPPGRGRGSSVCMLVGYLIGLSHIDPLHFDLSLERFLPDDDISAFPDIDLDFPRNIRNELIKRIHKRYGWDRAALTGMFSTYKAKGIIRDLGLALDLPPNILNILTKLSDHNLIDDLKGAIKSHIDSGGSTGSQIWQHLLKLSIELEGFPKYLAQHPGGMVVSSDPLIDLVPIQPSAIEERYIMQWDKQSISDAGFVKIDFLALGVLSQLEEALELIEKHTERRLDLSRIDFNDQRVYDLICQADTIGVFQVESAAQMQTTPRLKPRNLFDMARQVASVRPGVGANDGVSRYIRRRQGIETITYDHPLEYRALERTLGIILFQDQVNQIAIDVAGFSPSDADQLRRAYGKSNKAELVSYYWNKFRDGAAQKDVYEETARKIFSKFNGQYMFPESHAFAFGVTAYQTAWLKVYYPLEFYVSIFNQQPMGFYNLETLKEDAMRHGIRVLHPHLNKSQEKCTIENDSIRLGFLNVKSIGKEVAKRIVQTRDISGNFKSVEEFMNKTKLLRIPLENLADAGGFDSLRQNRRSVRWEIGLRYHTTTIQNALPLPTSQDMIDLHPIPDMDLSIQEYEALGLNPSKHIMAIVRDKLRPSITSSRQLASIDDGTEVTMAGLVIRRQRPKGKTVFITLEDEYGHTSLVLWPNIYKKYQSALKDALIIIKGNLSRREGVVNIAVKFVESIDSPLTRSASKNWH